MDNKMGGQKRVFSNNVRAVIDEFVPILKAWVEGRYAISIGGSHGKDTWDSQSDVDLRLFCDNDVPRPEASPELWKPYFTAVEEWGKKGVKVDMVWVRRIDLVDTALYGWINGEVSPVDSVWTIWGYHLLTDIYNQFIIEDLFDVIAAWKAKLQVYPIKLKRALLEKHLGSLKYWRGDYHYANKVKRQDIVFLAGLSARIVHDLMQVLFALNEVYFVGDGNNLDYAAKFSIKPNDLEERIKLALYPPATPQMLQEQQNILLQLIDEVDSLVKAIEKG
jgi:hypothetical protein